jgi:hypothetical protein
MMQGPDVVRSMRPVDNRWSDFFQDWASARNYFAGRPIYGDLLASAKRYILGLEAGEGEVPRASADAEVNAHPPTSILLFLPLAPLPYADAVLVWNLISLGALFFSLWIIRRELEIPLDAWSIFPFVTLLILSNPLRQQMHQGQLSLILLLLLTGSWAAQRSGRLGWTGVVLGTATAIKLFPGFLFLYFILRRQWMVVRTGIISFAVLTGLTVSVLGFETYQSYYYDVIPRLEVFRSGWHNASLPGLCAKLFNPLSKAQLDGWAMHGPIEPLWRSAVLAKLSTWLLCGVVVAVLSWIVLRARSCVETDQAFGLTIIAMLLVSPITWDHYLLLLLIPLAVMWVGLPSSNLVRATILILLIAVWANPPVIYDAMIPGGTLHGTAYPIHAFCVLSFQCHALLMLFALTAAIRLPETIPVDPLVERSSPSAGSATAKPSRNLATVCDQASFGY